jgi:hypothetical protein
VAKLVPGSSTGPPAVVTPITSQADHLVVEAGTAYFVAVQGAAVGVKVVDPIWDATGFVRRVVGRLTEWAKRLLAAAPTATVHLVFDGSRPSAKGDRVASSSPVSEKQIGILATALRAGTRAALDVHLPLSEQLNDENLRSALAGVGRLHWHRVLSLPLQRHVVAGLVAATAGWTRAPLVREAVDGLAADEAAVALAVSLAHDGASVSVAGGDWDVAHVLCAAPEQARANLSFTLTRGLGTCGPGITPKALLDHGQATPEVVLAARALAGSDYTPPLLTPAAAWRVAQTAGGLPDVEVVRSVRNTCTPKRQGEPIVPDALVGKAFEVAEAAVQTWHRVAQPTTGAGGALQELPPNDTTFSPLSFLENLQSDLSSRSSGEKTKTMKALLFDGGWTQQSRKRSEKEGRRRGRKSRKRAHLLVDSWPESHYKTTVRASLLEKREAQVKKRAEDKKLAARARRVAEVGRAKERRVTVNLARTTEPEGGGQAEGEEQEGGGGG